MRRRAAPLRIGLFVLGGLALIVAAVVVISGGRLFASREKALMHFEGSIYGLQPGAPVVFRGVRLGHVTSIGVVHDARSGTFAIPVVAELERSMIRSLDDQGAAPTLQSLVSQGLVAQLATQSLLTGLLYVDLDIRPTAARPSPRTATPAGVPTEIPTVGTTIQALQQQLKGLDVARLVDDISTIASSTRQLLADPQLAVAVAELARTGQDLRRLLQRVERNIDPLARSTQAALGDARRSVAQWGTAAEQVASSAGRLAGAAERAELALRGTGPLLEEARRTAEELGRTAAALRQAADAESPLMQNVDRAAQDLARASRAVRDLADLLERQPEALLRGRSTPP